jgi:hypothetical protein
MHGSMSNREEIREEIDTEIPDQHPRHIAAHQTSRLPLSKM